jgi:predicted DNA-binding transcriptional regulator AlpA
VNGDAGDDAVPVEPVRSAWSPLVRALARDLAKELAPLLQPPRAEERPRDEEQYLTVSETCERFEISRATFDRMLRDESSGLAEVIVRLPPVTGRVKVPLRAFEAWLRGRRQKRRRGRGGEA